MPFLTGDSAVDVAIGLGFVFFLLSVLSSSLNEAIAAVLNLRGKTLRAGIANLLPQTAAPTSAVRPSTTPIEQFYGNARVLSLNSNNFRSLFGQRGKKEPSYIPARVFALTALDVVAPAASGEGAGAAPAALAGLVVRARQGLDANPVEFTTSPAGRIVADALDLVQDVADPVEKLSAFLGSIETAFNDAMDRLSGWYKRRSQLILFVIALAFAAGLNVDAFTVGQRLWKDDALRAVIAAQASATVAGGKPVCPKPVPTRTPRGTSGSAALNSLANAANCLGDVRQLGLPIGWSKATSPHGVLQYLAKIVGFLVTAFAVMLGAPFWFDFLGKVSQLRSTGPKPSTVTPGPWPAPAPGPVTAARSAGTLPRPV